MPIPRRILEKRTINRHDIIEHSKNYLNENCVDDSLSDSLTVLDHLEVMFTYEFQRTLHGFKLNAEERMETETNFMRAILKYFVGR